MTDKEKFDFLLQQGLSIKEINKIFQTIPGAYTISDEFIEWKEIDKYFNIENGVLSKKYALPCNEFESIILPTEITKIARCTFDSSDIYEIALPPFLKEIDDFAFYECKNLNNVILPNTVEVINRSVFYGCKSLEHIKMSNNIKYIGDLAFQDDTALEEIFIPDTITYISSDAFVCCSRLKAIKTTNPQKIKKMLSIKNDKVVSINELER